MTTHCLGGPIDSAPPEIKGLSASKKIKAFFAWRVDDAPWTVRLYRDAKHRVSPHDDHASEHSVERIEEISRG